MLKRNPDQVSAWKRRSKRLKSKGRLNSRSKKRIARDAKEKPIRQAYLAQHPHCEAEKAGAPGECYGRLTVHEVLTRARGGSTGDPKNMRVCCVAHNENISQDVETMRWAYEAGFLLHAEQPGYP